MVIARNLQRSTTLAMLLLICLALNPGKSYPQGTIVIDLKKLPAKQIDISEYLEDMYIIPLETKSNNLMGRYSGIERDDSDIFYFSSENQTIYHFNANGKYLNSFCRLGKGPGEYSTVMNMRMIPGTQTLLLSDPRQSKMIHVTFAGAFIKEFKLPQSTGYFVVLNKNLIALHGGKKSGLSGNEPIKNDLIFMDLNGEIVGQKFHFDQSLSFEFSNAFTRPNADGSYYYSKQFDFNLYLMKDTSQPEIWLKLDYGKGMVSLDDLTGTGMEALMALRQAGKTFNIDQTYNTYDQFGLRNFKDRKPSLLLLDKKTRNLMAFGTDTLSSMGNFHGFPIRLPVDTYKTHFLFTMEAVDVFDLIKKLSPNQIKILKSKVKGFDRILDIKQEDNPILVFYRFRQF